MFKLPFTIIAGPPRPSLTLFRPLDEDIRSVEVNRESGSILIKGANLRIVSFEEVVNILGKSLSK